MIHGRGLGEAGRFRLGLRVERSGQPEVEHLDLALGGDLDVGGLEIAMDDPEGVRRLERFGDLAGDRQRLVDRDRAQGGALGQGRALDELQDQRPEAAGLYEVVDTTDVRVVERGQNPGLALEAGKALGVGDESLRQQLDGDLATEPRVAGPPHLAHTALTQLGGDLEMRQRPADHLAPVSRRHLIVEEGDRDRGLPRAAGVHRRHDPTRFFSGGIACGLDSPGPQRVDIGWRCLLGQDDSRHLGSRCKNRPPETARKAVRIHCVGGGGGNCSERRRPGGRRPEHQGPAAAPGLNDSEGLVEAAGIEPASEKLVRRASTWVALVRKSRHARCGQEQPARAASLVEYPGPSSRRIRAH